MGKGMFIPWFPPANQRINRQNNKQQMHLNWAVTELFWSVKHGFLKKIYVQFFTLGQIWKSLLPCLPHQFDAFFSYFYTLKHKNFHRIEKHWWHLDRAERAFNNRKCMKWDIVYKIASIGLRFHRPQRNIGYFLRTIGLPLNLKTQML